MEQQTLHFIDQLEIPADEAGSEQGCRRPWRLLAVLIELPCFSIKSIDHDQAGTETRTLAIF